MSGLITGQPAQRPPRGVRTVCPLALVLSPTREISMQIHEEAKKVACQTGVRVVVAYGRAPVNQQLRELERGGGHSCFNSRKTSRFVGKS
ncbi:DEAD-box ATP-dependent RNA helicase 52C-like isoform X4 [Cicer arietinum]|uniref:DEAD-box ATP-dependent RNA helicase 52C-like isoform X3 n=1 Tax=Cicer arietinum TaxID=3827 RepID=A0A1S2Z3U1_CICAR|nr:DEAD-box ATP-dependent RNA helicase 52C-like isoform X3 [Cicer arietinum]XP_012575403.1 DEAD-box ATP-dependent RNA helicase 52C-like isoform X3 [Cicer arietinum]